nr:unnamed protein product [Callosobruchus chinensis]
MTVHGSNTHFSQLHQKTSLRKSVRCYQRGIRTRHLHLCENSTINRNECHWKHYRDVR